MATSRTDIPRWTLVEHGLEQRQSNVRRAHRQLTRRYPQLSEDEVSDQYDGVLERVAMPRNADGTWPPGAFAQDDTFEGLDAWIVGALYYALCNYQRNRAARLESLDEAYEDDGRVPADPRLDPAALVEDRDAIDAMARGAPPEVRAYLLLAQQGYPRAEIQRITQWSTSRYKWIKAKSERHARESLLSIPALIARWLTGLRGKGTVGVGGAGAGASAGATIKAGTAVVASIAVVGGALVVSKPAHHSHHPARPHTAAAPAALAPPVVVAAKPQAVTTTRATTSKRTRSGSAPAHARTASAVAPGLSYLGAPTPQPQSQATAAGGATPSSSSAGPTHGPGSGGFSYLGAP